MPNINPTNIIPNEFYKQAAEICDRLPDIHFADIARVLYERDMYMRHNLTLCDAITGKPVENIKDILGLDDDPEKAKEIRSTKKLEPLKRRGRPRRREITFADGKIYAYPNQLDMLRMNGIKDVDVFPHNCTKDDDYCELEASKVNDLFTKAGLPIIKYVCYDFDGKKRSFLFPKEREAVNA